jgi:hypothetical protein
MTRAAVVTGRPAGYVYPVAREVAFQPLSIRCDLWIVFYLFKNFSYNFLPFRGQFIQLEAKKMPPVRHPFADQLSSFQDAQVTGYGSSRQSKHLGDLAEAQLPIAKQRQNP